MNFNTEVLHKLSFWWLLSFFEDFAASLVRAQYILNACPYQTANLLQCAPL